MGDKHVTSGGFKKEGDRLTNSFPTMLPTLFIASRKHFQCCVYPNKTCNDVTHVNTIHTT